MQAKHFTPCQPQMAAALGALEAMQVWSGFKQGWRVWSVPLQHPARVNGWPAVWYR